MWMLFEIFKFSLVTDIWSISRKFILSLHLIHVSNRKIRHYVHWIWRYKVLSLKRLFQNRIMWEEEWLVTLGQCIKTKIKDQHQSKIPLQYVKRTHWVLFRNINLKLNHHTGDKWFMHGPKSTRRISCQVWNTPDDYPEFSLNTYRRSMVTIPIRFFFQEGLDRNILGKWTYVWIIANALDISY